MCSERELGRVVGPAGGLRLSAGSFISKHTAQEQLKAISRGAKVKAR